MTKHTLISRIALPLMITASVVACGDDSMDDLFDGAGSGGHASSSGSGGSLGSGGHASGGEGGGLGGSHGQGGSTTSASGGAEVGGSGGSGGGDVSSSSGQGGGMPHVCGDQTCDANENCTSCVQDCGACPSVCGDSVCDPGEVCAADCACTAHTDCGALELCLNQACVNGLGRNYLFTVEDGLIPPYLPNSMEPWDPIGPPDPYVDFCTPQGCPSNVTTTRNDTYFPAWGESFSVQFPANGSGQYMFRMWDEDLQLDDFAMQTNIGTPAEWIDVVRTNNGMYGYEPISGLALYIRIVPQ